MLKSTFLEYIPNDEGYGAKMEFTLAMTITAEALIMLKMLISHCMQHMRILLI